MVLINNPILLLRGHRWHASVIKDGNEPPNTNEHCKPKTGLYTKKQEKRTVRFSFFLNVFLTER